MSEELEVNKVDNQEFYEPVTQPDSNGGWIAVAMITAAAILGGCYYLGTKVGQQQHKLQEIGRVNYTNGPEALVYYCEIHERQEIVLPRP